MSDDKRLSTLTPIPLEDLKGISRNLSKVGTAITRMEGKIDTVKDDLLPPVAEAAKEARDGVMKLNGRVTALEDQPSEVHECFEEERQQRQDTDIATNRTSLASTGRLVWWLMGVAITVTVVVGSAAMGFAISSSVSAAAIETKVEDLDGVDEDVVELKVRTQALEKSQAQDRATYLRTVRDLPSKVVQVTKEQEPTLEEAEEAARESEELTDRERDLVIRVFKAAQKRSSTSTKTP